MLWFWRCKREIPMLNESEFAEISDLRRRCMLATKELRQKTGVPLNGVRLEERFRPVFDRYEKMTGMRETNVNAVMHHRLSMYGPPCKRCGKPLRTPKAKLCAACMFPVGESL